MPHKRAKYSEREKKRAQSGLNLPPAGKHAIDNEDIPKGAARVLNAAKIQEEYRQKRKREQEEKDDLHGGAPRKKTKRKGSHAAVKEEMKIMPGESIAHFNRRVEDSMRSAVRTAVKQSSTIVRKTKKEEEMSKSQSRSNAKGKAAKPDASLAQADSPSKPSAPVVEKQQKLKDFERLSTAAPKRLNDIVQAPPEIKKLPRGAKARPANQPGVDSGTTLRQGALSMAQRAMLEEERVRAVRMYREMKRAKASG
ncbi:uncharacterized protein LAESUDRAFT_664796 [Laetiporus sulphureus 93-53]|uniref:Uncharacterized protein n=1 Tax=Laetiporus sulphureus 93-53 TaxID=1314785 RepID=A0A165BGU3_9APHY|nr:uncharacterized protein LAESUDRAFT_664796 [Laetiporus sulphureus 93-53]KZT01028.1 hypothetical protein LAESUDRAFT_664796 [Laetiporus sulphureus 93-53]